MDHFKLCYQIKQVALDETHNVNQKKKQGNRPWKSKLHVLKVVSESVSKIWKISNQRYAGKKNQIK